MSKVSICSDLFSSSGGPHKNTGQEPRAKKKVVEERKKIMIMSNNKKGS